MAMAKEEITKITAELISTKASEMASEEIADYIKVNPISISEETITAIKNEAVSEIAFLFTQAKGKLALAEDRNMLEDFFNKWIIENESRLKLMITGTIKEKAKFEEKEEESGYFMDQYLKDYKRKLESRHKRI